jgi:D-3-phosphoglycerate dehydrogenase
MDSVAEHTIALMLALAKKLFFTHFHLKKGGWRDEKLLSYELLGKTVGIIGLGSIGHAVARKLRGFEVKILAHDPYVTQTRAKEVLADLVSLETLLKQSDFVTVNAALTEDTRHLIGENELKMMKRSAFIVNTSRGALIDERSLYKALSERWIAGAALDVFEEEPARDNLLFGLDNVIVTPHVAGFTYEALRRETSMAAEEVLRVLRGEKPKFLVNPAVFSNS